MNHANLRPFEETEKYIAFLERPDRAAWQRPDAVVATLGLKGDETLVDVGAGSGYFAFRFASALPRGSVVASDIEPEMVRHMHHKAMTDGIRNLRVVLGKTDDPEIPQEANLVFVCDVLHHVADRAGWLSKLAGEMPKGARLVVVEFKEGPLPEGPPEQAKIPKAELIRLVTATGLRLESEKLDLLPYQSLLTFRKP
jgi:ubiquinone/menaquinone biosynthesis C-methylase UbiE